MSTKEDSNSAILRAFSVVEAVVQSNEPVSIGDLIDRLGLPKPTVHRMVAMLERAALLDREPDSKRVIAGSRLTTMGLDAILNSRLRGPWRAILRGLHTEVKETCSFSMLHGNEVIVLDRIESEWGLRLHVPVGARVPLHCTSSGKLFLSYLTRTARDRLLTKQPLEKLTDHTITDREQLETALAVIRKSGVGTDNGEYMVGLIGVATPILGSGKRVIATLSVNAPAARLSMEGALEHVPALQKAALAMGDLFAKSRDE
ncbi:IclR family transcriptional regulator [Paraburkholderia sp.]|uniref:IclR family transcriptional regulator n=1 Tax=Paraburkholderia sp. TaxID=1926495 RepID=UPI003C7CE93C